MPILPKHLTRMFASLLLVLGAFVGANPALANVPTSPEIQSVQDAEITPYAAWVPWDYAKITSAAKCESRRAYLISVDPDLTKSNSACHKFARATCPVTYYWMVMRYMNQTPTLMQEFGVVESSAEVAPLAC